MKPGDAVIYYPTRGGKGYRATVDSEPWKLGGHTEVVMLCDLDPAYGEDTGRPGRTRVAAAATSHVAPARPRDHGEGGE